MLIIRRKSVVKRNACRVLMVISTAVMREVQAENEHAPAAKTMLSQLEVQAPPRREYRRPANNQIQQPPWDSECVCEASRWHAHRRSKPFRSTYYDDRMRASPALLRARAPYLVKNTITGFAICSLVIGICTIRQGYL